MRKVHKIFHIAAQCITATLMCILVAHFLISSSLFPNLTIAYARRHLGFYRSHVTVVSEYLAGLGHTDIYIPISSEPAGMMYVDGGYDIKIQNDKVVQAIRVLKWSGYDVINKGENAILFQIWSTLDVGRGIVMSMNETEPRTSDMTVCVMLEPGWYYYEEK